VYREVYHQIPALWRRCDNIITEMASGDAFHMIGPIMCTKDRLTLPNGMAITYHNLRYIDNNKYRGWSFTFGGRVKMLWGGTMVENMVQALARLTVTEHMLQVRRDLGYRPALQAHDELVYVVPEKDVEDFDKEVLAIMKAPPSFAPDLPIDAEAAWGDTYGDAK
jgi:DNA polymerase